MAKAEARNGGRMKDDAFMLIITMTSLRCFAELRYLSHFRFLTYSKCFTSVASLRCFKYLKDLT